VLLTLTDLPLLILYTLTEMTLYCTLANVRRGKRHTPYKRGACPGELPGGRCPTEYPDISPWTYSEYVRIPSASCLSKTLGVVYRRPFVDWQRRRVDVCRCAMSSAIQYVVAFFDVYSRRLYDVSVNLRTKPAVTISLLTYTSQLRSMYFAAARTINFIYKT